MTVAELESRGFDWKRWSWLCWLAERNEDIYTTDMFIESHPMNWMTEYEAEETDAYYEIQRELGLNDN